MLSRPNGRYGSTSDIYLKSIETFKDIKGEDFFLYVTGCIRIYSKVLPGSVVVVSDTIAVVIVTDVVVVVVGVVVVVVDVVVVVVVVVVVGSVVTFVIVGDDGRFIDENRISLYCVQIKIVCLECGLG